jgi:hypothetical protein
MPQPFRRPAAALTCLAWLLVTDVTAQPLRLPRADASASVGWLNADVSNLSERYDRWASRRATLAGHIGVYWTEHWKTEATIERSNTQDRWQSFPVYLPSGEMLYGASVHRFQDTRASLGQFYQFGHNAWTHVLLGGGIGVIHRQTTSEFEPLTRYDRVGPIVVQPGSTSSSASTWTGPFAAAAVKAYVTPRVFVRSDAQADFSSHLEALTFRVGVGVDF